MTDPAGVLWRGGVHYLAPPDSGAEGPDPTPDEITGALAGLARSARPREAEAIVAALLCRPDWADAAAAGVALLPEASAAARELRYAYVAATYLQRHWEPLLRLYWRGAWTTIPARYTDELALPRPADDPFGAHWNVTLLADRRCGESGCDFASEFDRIIHHIEGQWRAEGRRPSAAALAT